MHTLDPTKAMGNSQEISESRSNDGLDRVSNRRVWIVACAFQALMGTHEKWRVSRFEALYVPLPPLGPQRHKIPLH